MLSTGVRYIAYPLASSNPHIVSYDRVHRLLFAGDVSTHLVISVESIDKLLKLFNIEVVQYLAKMIYEEEYRANPTITTQYLANYVDLEQINKVKEKLITYLSTL